MNRNIVGLAAVLAVATMGASPLLAVAPTAQTSNISYVVRILFGDATGKAGSLNGTGTIVDNIQNANGSGTMAILTADHVVATAGFGSPLRAAIGYATGNANAFNAGTFVTNPYSPMGVTAIYRGGSTGLEDLAVIDVNYGVYNANLAVANFGSYGNFIANPANGANGVNPVTITDVGYGLQGNLNPAPATGYLLSTPRQAGTQMYNNENIAQVVPNFAGPGGYTYTAAEWNIQNPTAATAPAGSGAAFKGDSGGPYFLDQNDSMNQITPFASLDEIVVHTGGTQPDATGLKAFGLLQFGDMLTLNDLVWIGNAAQSIPEPSNALFALALPAVMLRRPRRA